VCVEREHVHEFHSHINSIKPHIKFTTEIESEGSTAFLDTKTTRQEEALSLYLSTGKLLTPTVTLISNHTTIPSSKHSVVRTLMDRAKNIPSTEEEVSRETKQVAKALAANNYPTNFIHNGRQLNTQQEMNETDQRGLVILPCAKGFSERVANVLRGFNIKVTHKVIRTIANTLKKPKDKIEKEASRGIAYKIKCKDCDCAYVGQTLRAKNTRKRTRKGHSHIG